MDEIKFQKLVKKEGNGNLIYSDINNINDDGLQTKCLIIKDDDGNINDPIHRTIPFLTKYEKARILGYRAEQLSRDNDPFISTNLTNLFEIAEEELKRGKIPFIIQRPLPNGESEYWKVSDLELLD